MTRLRQFIEQESDSMQSTLRLYLLRAGVTGERLASGAAELWQDVVVEALRHEERFHRGGQPRAWLLGIAANLIKRRQTEIARRERREPLVRDLYPNEALSEDDVFDRVAALAETPDEDAADALLSPLAPDDQRVLRLAILTGLDGETLAAELGVSPGAARVRLHRALGRLREAHAKENHDA